MQVQFLIDKKSAGADHVVGWTVLKPGASHESHRHHNCDEFFIVLKGHGHIYHRRGRRSRPAKATWSIRRAAAGTASTTPRTRTWCWSGAGWAPARSRLPATKSIPRAIHDARRLTILASSNGMRRAVCAVRGAQASTAAQADRLEGRASARRPARKSCEHRPRRWSASCWIARCCRMAPASRWRDGASRSPNRKSRSSSRAMCRRCKRTARSAQCDRSDRSRDRTGRHRRPDG